MKRLNKSAAMTLLALGFAWAGPASGYLGSMSPADRANAVVDLEFSGDEGKASEAEALWNSGEYAKAVALIEGMEKEGVVNLGISWREPVPTQGPKWGQDVQVTGSGLQAVSSELARAAGGNLFALVRGLRGDTGVWTLNMSTDTGETWAETYRWVLAYGYSLYDVSIAEYSDYVYVLYSSDFAPKMFLRRFSQVDGSYDNGFGLITVDSAGSDFTEVSLEPNRAGSSEIYATGITGGYIRFLYSADDGLSWTDFSPPVSDAAGGLDTDYGWMSSQHLLWASWVNASGNLCAAGVYVNGWELHENLDGVYSSYPATSVAQRGDTVLVASTYQESGDDMYVMYYITYDDGDNWLSGQPLGATDSTNHPDVTARGGEGWQMAFVKFRNGDADELIGYTHRTYAGPGSWDPPQYLSQHDGWRWFQPSIEYLGTPGLYGVTYIDDDGITWFNASTWSETAEGERPSPVRLVAAPVPSGALLRFSLPSDGPVSLKVYDARGSLVRDLSGSYSAGAHEVRVRVERAGTYFVLLRALGSQAKAKFTSVR